MSIRGLVEKLAEYRVDVWLDGNKLRYRAPKQALSPELMGELKAGKEALVAYLQEQQQQPFPLTYGQRALWFLHKTAPDSPAYNVAFSAVIASQLDSTVMQRALAYLSERHAALRLRFTDHAGEPLQYFSPDSTVDYQVIDAAAWDDERVKSEVDNSYQAPFSLDETQALFRVRIFSRGSDSHIILIVFHHIIGDGWSLWLLLDELGRAYSSLLAGHEPALPATPVSYRSYALQQQQRLVSADAERDWVYWRDKFADMPPLLNLPTSRPFPAKRSYQGASYPLRIVGETMDKLRVQAAEHGVTLYVLLLAGYQLLLHRCCNQDLVCVGTPLAGRDDDDYAHVVGYFVNPLPLLSKLDDRLSVADFIDAGSREILAAMQHQHFPLALVLERLPLARDTGRPPLFQAAFVFQQLQKAQQILDLNSTGGSGSVDWGGLRLSPYTLYQQEGQFDLSLELMEAGGDLIGAFKFNTDVLDHGDAARFADYYLHLLEALPNHKNGKAAELPLLNEQYRALILQDFTRSQSPDWECGFGSTGFQSSVMPINIPDLLTRQAQQTPDQPALVFNDEVISYSELERRSNRLAHYLQQRGAGPETLVAVSMERSLDLVIALHAIVKAGAAYVPLDPDYPQERLDYMIVDSGAKLLLTQAHLKDRLGSYQGELLVIDELSDEISRQAEHAPEVTIHTDNIAYVIYTSGSTGQPKGVPNTHKGLLNRIQWMQRSYLLTTQDSVLQKTPYSFDVSVWEFFWPLVTGAKLVIAKPGGHKDSAYLCRLIQQQQVSTVHFVPSMLQAFIEDPEAQHCTSLTRIICSGEALPQELSTRVHGKLSTQLHNLYGPTEAAIDVSAWPAEATGSGSIVPIGRPIDNIQLYILDKRLQAAPIGVAGELYIAGIGLARGYHGKAKLTAERFIPHPYGNGARLYRTGDISRYRADGVIEYLGREDGQVKLRGFRIELGEIEAVLKKHAAVENCVVIADDVRGEKCLLAYLTLSETDQEADSAELREYLQSALPDFMVPSAFIVLPEIPLSANGKVDRKALPAFTGETPDAALTLPENEVQQRIADIWRQLLKHDGFGIHSDFFLVGGHSLLALRLVALLVDAFKTELSVEDVFGHATIARQAALLEKAEGQQNTWPAIAADTDTSAPLAFSQERLCFMNTLENARTLYHIPLAFHLRGVLHVDALQQALHELMLRQQALRTAFVEQDGRFQQQLCEPLEPLVVYDHSAVQERGLEAILRKESETAFDLERGFVFKAALLESGDRHWILLLVVHHIVADGWSVNILLDELSRLYRLQLGDSSRPLAPLPVAYRDFCRWQRQLMDEGWFREAEAYWLDKLGGAPTQLALSYDKARPMLPGFRGAMQYAVIDANTKAALQAFAQQHGATPFMAVLAAFGLVLYRYSGQTDFLVGTPAANRKRAEVHGLVGLFVNTVLMRFQVDPDGDFEQLLTAVRQTALGAYQHQHYPFERLVDALQPLRDLSVMPLFQTMFVYQEQAPLTLVLPELDIEPVVLPSAVAKCDLSLYVSEQDDGWSLALEYSTDLFYDETTAQMLALLGNAITELVQNPHCPLNRLRLLSDAQEKRCLHEWNATDHELGIGLIPGLLTRQAQQTPDQPALVFNDEVISYSELERRSNRLAHTLQQYGARPETLVAVSMERSLDLVIALHAIVKAGAAYVPLDPDYPKERLDYMIVDSGAKLLLTQAHLKDRLGSYRGELLVIDELSDEINRQAEHAPEVTIHTDNIAYVIYTSGSTGQPKGVPNTHKGLLNRIQWMQRAYSLTAQDNVLQKTPYSFDVSVWEFFWPLLTGAKLVIAKPGGHKDSAYLCRLIQQQQVSTVHFVPSMLQAFIEDPEAQNCTSLTRIICSGEALPQELSTRVHGKLAVKLYNLYGPTEAAIDVSAWPAEATGSSSIVPIGRPIDNIQLYILDKRLQAVPIGVAGELYIAGIGLARGYHGKAKLTAERFIPNPYGNGARLYRTSDISRYRADGVIEYLGREDGQVKLRGFRIELGEIEAVLKQYPGIKDAAVKVWESAQGKRLVAYVVGEGIDEDALKQHLQQLPDYMRPLQFVSLDELPLTTSGKLDRKALPQAEISARQQYVAARNEREQTLADIWRDVLHLPQVGINDNYFELGGDSILSLQIISKAKQAGLKLRVEDLFLAQTIAELAAVAQIAGIEYPHESAVEADRYPLTPTQTGILFHALYESGSAVYCQQIDLLLAGHLHADLFRQAWRSVFKLHDALSMVFVWENTEQPYQHINPVENFSWTELDWRELADTEQRQRFSELMRQQAAQGFAVSRGPLAHFTLARLGATQYRLLWSYHHLLMDGWSLPLVLGDVARYYAALSSGEPYRPERSRSFADYVAWLSRQEIDGAQSYWRQQLAAINAATSIPCIDPGTSESAYHNTLLALDSAFSDGLRAFIKSQHLTLAVVLQAAWALLLNRYSGETDVVFGITVSGRPAELQGVASVVGLFINTVPVTAKVDDAVEVSAWLQALAAEQFKREAQSYVPLAKITEWSPLPAGQALIQSLLVLENYPLKTGLIGNDADGLRIVDAQFTEQTNYPLTLVILPDDEIQIKAMHQGHVFDAATVARLLRHFSLALAFLAQSPAKTLGAFEVLQGEERELQLRGWNATDYGVDTGLIPGLLTRQAQQTPDHPALIFNDETLSYRELERRSNRLAHTLQQRGAGPETLVAVSMERSLDLVIALHAIVKAGAAYVPLDPDYPKERLDYMIVDSGAKLLLTQAHLKDRLSSYQGELLAIDELSDEISRQAGYAPDVTIHPDNIAYVIYTSGSTGQPKGVPNTHKGLLNRIQWMQRAYSLTAQDNVLQKTPYSFDVSVWEFFWPLVTGAKLVIAKPGGHKDSAYLCRLIQQQQVSTVHFVPSMLQAFIEDPEAQNCTSLTRIICSGEALPQELSTRVHGKLTAKLYNLYGPTEAAIDVSTWPAEATGSSSIVPIGRPIDNIQLYILDKRLQAAPIGVAGELYIAGIGLARGYHGKAKLTAERFIPNPYGHGARLYRTGDISRYRADGVIEYLGREDGQVKLRGFRIELGEIEAVLKQYPGIKDAAVKVWDKRLIAYVVGAGIDEDALKQHLQQLPDYMRPLHFVSLDELPLTTSGKLDRKALPQAEITVRQQYVAARNEREQTLADIWRDVLHLPQVGIDDNYFELGGDSILSLQIISKAKQAGLAFSLKQLFEAQTIAALAGETQASAIAGAEQGNVSGPFPATPIQCFFFAGVQQDAQHFNQSVLLEVAADLDDTALALAVDALLKHHDALRLGFKIEDGNASLVIKAEVDIAEVFQTGVFSNDEDLTAQARRIQASFNADHGALIRVVHFHRANQGLGRLLLVIHHLAVDGVSWRILLEDLHRAYGAAAQGENIQLPQKTTSYIRWSERLRQWAAEHPDQAYWRQQAAMPFAELTPDHADAGQVITLADTAVESLQWDGALTQALMQAPRLLQAGVEEVLLAALVESLWARLGKEALSIELEGHGREDLFDGLDLSRTIGWFTSLFPLAVTADGTALEAVKSAYRALPNRGLSYGVLRYLSSDLMLREQLASAASTGLRFNYLGRFSRAGSDAVFIRQALEGRGDERSPRQLFDVLMDINSVVHDDCLHIDWRYSPLQFRPESIRNLLDAFAQNLERLLPNSNGMEEPDAQTSDAIEDIYALSPLQQGLLFHSIYARESASYLQQVSWRFNGRLDADAWRDALQQLLQRHPVLRTGFDWRGAEPPLQIVYNTLELPWREADLSGLDSIAQQQAVADRLAEDRLHAFNTAVAPLLRCTLLRLGEDRHYFVWTYHHILFDGWSLPKLLEDMFALYAANMTGQPANLPQRRPFKAYIDWLAMQDGEALKRYWTAQLEGFTTPHHLAIDLGGEVHSRQAQYDELNLYLDDRLTADIDAYARSRRVTLNTLLQGAWAILLSRYCNSRDIVFGATVAGRPDALAGVEDSIGLYINTVPVRVQVSAGLSPGRFLQQLFAENTERLQYAHAQLAELQRWSPVDGGLALFDTLFIFENYPLAETLEQESAELKLDAFQVLEQTDLPLTLLITPGTRLALKISYQQQRFEAAKIEALLGHYRQILRAIANVQSLEQISLLTEAEQAGLLADTGLNMAADYAPNADTLPGLIARQTRSSPERIAVRFEGRALTYSELERQSERLANVLLTQGAEPEKIVAVCIERCELMLVALLAVLKTGAAYLPLDPQLPAKRLQQMVVDSGALLVLAKGSSLSLDYSAAVLDVENLPETSAMPIRKIDLHPDNLAYIIYTSGSTGTPKGVQISHRAIVNFLLTTLQQPGLTAQDRLLAVTTPAFDIAALELYLPLCTGASVVIADSLQTADGYALLDLLNQHDITAMQATPATWRLLLAAGWRGSPRFKALCGGEALAPNLAVQLRECAGQVWNLYGPTETTVWSMRWLLDGSATVKLGAALGNTRLYVVDDDLNLLPPGIPGELMIAGSGVARGYRNRADLTAERFIPDPFSNIGERMYRTGDQVRRLDDGSIEYLGRLDFQAKIRGYRIELGEIESVLEKHPGIRQAVAVVSGSDALIAYYSGDSLADTVLRAWCAETLPAYMVPGDFIQVASFALTHSGKVDRKALPKPERRVRADSPIPLQSASERLIGEIWSEVLQRDDFGRDDNFFDSGGHSLLLMQVWHLLQQKAQHNLQTVDLFRYPTIAKLAARLDQSTDDRGGEPVAAVKRAGQRAQQQKNHRLGRARR